MTGHKISVTTFDRLEMLLTIGKLTITINNPSHFRHNGFSKNQNKAHTNIVIYKQRTRIRKKNRIRVKT